MSTQLNFRKILKRATFETPHDASMERHASDNWIRRSAWDKIMGRCSPAAMLAVVDALEESKKALENMRPYTVGIERSPTYHKDHSMRKTETEDTKQIDAALSAITLALSILSPEQKTEGKEI